jgi:hypothetical protein
MNDNEADIFYKGWLFGMAIIIVCAVLAISSAWCFDACEHAVKSDTVGYLSIGGDSQPAGTIDADSWKTQTIECRACVELAPGRYDCTMVVPCMEVKP